MKNFLLGEGVRKKMIESISIQNEACYGSTPQVLSGLSQFNFIFGSNATGKTTISRIIANESVL